MQTLLEVRSDFEDHFLFDTVILGFLTILKNCQALSIFEALNSAHLSKCQRDVNQSVQKRLRTMAFSMVSTGDSDIPSSSEMKDEPAFMPCRESRPSFESGHLGVHSTWGRKHRVALTYLFLREGSSWGACGKLPYLFSRRQGIILIPRRSVLHGSYLNLLYSNWWSSVLETVVSGNLSSFLKGVTQLVLYEVDGGMLMEPKQGNLASYLFDLVYTELFCVPEVTIVFYSSCDSVVGDSLEFNQANRDSLRVWLGKRNCSACNAGESVLISRRGVVSWVFSSCGRNLEYILELRWWWQFKTGVCSVKSGHLSRYVGHLRNVN